jgi:general secretion pathway protein G
MRSRSGFTLIELLVVIAIIAILAAVVAPNAYRAIEKAKVAGAIADYQAIKSAAMSYYSDTGTWPADATGLPPGRGGPTNGFLTDDGTAGWNGPYLDKWPSPRWIIDSNNIIQFSTQSYDWNGDGSLDASQFVAVYDVPTPAGQQIDLQLDGTQDAAAGKVQYFYYPVGTTATVMIFLLVSTDVEVN